MLEYALPAQDQDLLDFIRTSFEWARAQGEQTLIKPSTPLRAAEYQAQWHLGYFPENLSALCHEQAESCEVADMIGIGLKLSAAGLGTRDLSRGAFRETVSGCVGVSLGSGIGVCGRPELRLGDRNIWRCPNGQIPIL